MDQGDARKQGKKKGTRILILLAVLLLLMTGFVSEAGARAWRSGDKGDEIKQIQAALAERGYLAEEAATGTFEKKTVSAIKAFQKAEGLEATGVADIRTQIRLLGANALGETVETLLALPPEETGQTVCLGIYGLVPQDDGAYALSSIADQAVIGLYTLKEKILVAVITVDYDRETIEISLTMPKGASPKKAKSTCEKAAGLLGELMATYAGRGYAPPDGKGHPSVRFGTVYHDFNLYLRGWDSNGQSLCYGIKSRQHPLRWRD